MRRWWKALEQLAHDGSRWRRRDLVPVLLASVAVASVMGVRLVGPCDADPGCFVVAGGNFVDPDESGLPVLSAPAGDGYDGQFFWRLSRSPSELGMSPVHGVVLDTPIRVGRPAYPAVVWAVSGGGREGVVDWVMILVNVVMTGLLCLVFAVLARRHGVSPWIGALAALWPGLLFALGRDLSEPGSALLVVAGLTAVSRDRPGTAGLAWAGAVLWREQAIVIPAAYGCWWLFTLLLTPGRDLLLRAVLAWVTPLAAFTAWQAVAARAVGEAPVFASGEKNLVVPLTGLVPEAAGWVQLHDGVAGLVWLFQLALALVIGGTAVLVGLRNRRWEVIGVVAGLTLLLSASSNVWSGPAHLRYATDVVATAWFVLLTSRPEAPERARRVGVSGAARRLLPTLDVRGGLVTAQAAAALLACSYLVRTP